MIYQQLFASNIWRDASVIGITISQNIEIDTKPIIEQAQLENKTICIPRTLADWQMEFVELTDQTNMEKTSHNLLEPVNGNVFSHDEIDLMLVPGVAYTEANFRLGFGGGYYDRYLANFNGETVALSLPEQQNGEFTWPIKPYDIRIKHVLVAMEDEIQ
ncbi:5-formyltetrahydrofolate cyclo-ligase [Paucilactobacillus hokkaidonensis]|uniref:5-formyltetrahydrofolate cyclo-ligase n=1 Tax=Paucilactobacillus hokkaidonensis TaxID=1193095 RepID=UPI0006D1A568|nr:5-formyltetrahydrofolate cyclo-ligase [Paucilactobacillus hokkaidonensis]